MCYNKSERLNKRAKINEQRGHQNGGSAVRACFKTYLSMCIQINVGNLNSLNNFCEGMNLRHEGKESKP